MWMGISQNGTKLNMQQCLATSISYHKLYIVSEYLPTDCSHANPVAMWFTAGLAGSHRMKEQLCAKTGLNAGLLKNYMVLKSAKIVGWTKFNGTSN